MNSPNFSSITYGKWILAGEHAVLRGCPALVFPVLSLTMKLEATELKTSDLTIELTGSRGEELRPLIDIVLTKALEQVSKKKSSLNTRLKVINEIPLGAGLGASAALCVNIARWINYLGFIKESKIYEFSRQLENIFHGESSGVDIAATSSTNGVCFYRSNGPIKIQSDYKPEIYLYYSGQRGITSDCVEKVKKLMATAPERGQAIDQQMEQSVLKAIHAFESSNNESQSQLIEAIDSAKDCFEQWELTEGHLTEKMKWLKEQGAIAVKPTGSGDGGYILSLWNSPPPQELNLIPCFR